MFTHSEENYLKAIYHLEEFFKNGISTNAIAKKLSTKASSVTDMVQKLSDKKLVIYRKYQGVTLTDFGRQSAAIIIRKHRLWEVFLFKILDFPWDEVHEIAEQLEHIRSEALVDRLDEFLGFPTVDPHGDPIPDKEGKITKRRKVKLSSLKENEQSILLSIKDSSDDFLRYLDKKGIAIGHMIKVVSIEPFDKSLQIAIDNKEIIITEEIANNLLVKELG